jgi:hypothetical protein
MNRDFWNIFPVSSDQISGRIPISIGNILSRLTVFDMLIVAFIEFAFRHVLVYHQGFVISRIRPP